MGVEADGSCGALAPQLCFHSPFISVWPDSSFKFTKSYRPLIFGQNSFKVLILAVLILVYRVLQYFVQ